MCVHMHFSIYVGGIGCWLAEDGMGDFLDNCVVLVGGAMFEDLLDGSFSCSGADMLCDTLHGSLK